MKRICVIIVLTALVAAAASAAPPPRTSTLRRKSRAGSLPEPKVIGKVLFADVRGGMRIRVHLGRGKPILGTVSKRTDLALTLDLSAEESGLSGKFTFYRPDVVRIEHVKPMTAEERRDTFSRRRQKNVELRQAARIRIERIKSGKKEKEAAARARREAGQTIIRKEKEEEYRKLLKEFPPDEGWGEDKLRSIREEWILKDLPPNAKEGRFVTIYDEWKKAKETVGVIDARRAQEEGELLLMRFPPGEQWNRARLKQVLEKEAKGEKTTDDETEFKDNFEAWLRAQQAPAAASGEKNAPAENAPEETAAK